MSKNILITGASSGIGEALARRLAKEGNTVGLMARRIDRLEAIAQEIREQGGRAIVLPGDVADRTAMFNNVARFIKEAGPVDMFIVNAGISQPTPAHRFDAEIFSKIICVNLIGAANGIAAVLPGMLERNQGHIVGIGSLAGYRGLPGYAAYCASKAGLWSLFESIRLDLRGTDIAVTIIHPGFIRTPLTEKNRFPMPFLMDVDRAVDHIIKAIRRRRRVYAFPWPMAMLVRMGRSLPSFLYDFVMPGGR